MFIEPVVDKIEQITCRVDQGVSSIINKDPLVSNQGPPCTESGTYTKTTTKTTYNKGVNSTESHAFAHPSGCMQIDDSLSEVISYYLNKYRQHSSEKHPPLKAKQWQRVVETMSEVDITMSAETWKEVIDAHFRTDYQKGCDYRIMHFTFSDQIIRLRQMELNIV